MHMTCRMCLQCSQLGRVGKQVARNFCQIIAVKISIHRKGKNAHQCLPTYYYVHSNNQVVIMMVSKFHVSSLTVGYWKCAHEKTLTVTMKHFRNIDVQYCSPRWVYSWLACLPSQSACTLFNISLLVNPVSSCVISICCQLVTPFYIYHYGHVFIVS